MSNPEDTIDRLQKAFKIFIRSHQFRDRNEMIPFGVTVSQCYAIDALGDYGSLTMSELAENMYLTTATMTGIVDELIKKELAERKFDENDRRVIRVELTLKGKEVYSRIREKVIERYRGILEKLKLSDKEVERIISVIEELTAIHGEGSSAFSQR
jgi:MarR family 2-MHQ and catechol resistance regulon transcriptional repressor